MDNRSSNCKNRGSANSTRGANSTNAAQNTRSTQSTQNTQSSNEHKHPNQYTKGADDEGAKNAKTTDSKAAKGSKNCR